MKEIRRLGMDVMGEMQPHGQIRKQMDEDVFWKVYGDGWKGAWWQSGSNMGWSVRNQLKLDYERNK